MNTENKVVRPKITQKMRHEIAEEFNHTCVYCNQKIEENEYGSIDHYYPVSTFPELSGERWNLMYSCMYCNRIKGGHNPETINGTGIINPREGEFSEHVKEENGIYIGLTEKGKNTIDFFKLNRKSLIEARIRNTIKDLSEESDYKSFEAIINSEKTSYEKFLESINNISALSEIEIENTDVNNYKFKLLYANAITSMETYLSDTFIKKVTLETVNLKKFVETFHDFKKVKFNYCELFTRFESVETHVTKTMLDVIYHNLDKVKGMYKDTLDIEFPNNIDNLRIAVDIRHDIVHRNGFNKKGIEHDIESKMIKSLTEDIKLLVDYIENQL